MEATYTKAEFGRDLLSQIEDGYDPVRIARWAFSKFMDPDAGIRDKELSDLILEVVVMEEGPEFEYSEEELRQFAERLVMSQ